MLGISELSHARTYTGYKALRNTDSGLDMDLGFGEMFLHSPAAIFLLRSLLCARHCAGDRDGQSVLPFSWGLWHGQSHPLILSEH